MIIWIASYPKSGNTWIRLFFKKYLEHIDHNFHLGHFPDLSQSKNLQINYENFDNIIKNWSSLQSLQNLNSKINLIKTHNALCTIGKYKFTDKTNTLGVIYLVRDPRDVLVSYAHHLGQTHQQVLRNMLSSNFVEKATFEGKLFRRSLLGKWSDNYNSWKSNKNWDVLIVKYEDLVQKTELEFLRILNFLKKIDGIEINKEKLRKSIDETSFEKLKKDEKDKGFKEATTHGVFFRKGIVGDWKNSLDDSIYKVLEKEFEIEMKELNYI